MKELIKNIDIVSALMLLAMLMSDIFVWHVIFLSFIPDATAKSTGEFSTYFLPVTSGSSEVATLPGNVIVMTDAGSDGKVIDDLSGVLASDTRYIDAAIISGNQASDFSGYITVLDHYQVGAFFYNGREPQPGSADMAAWQQLVQKIAERHIPLVSIGKNDVLHYGNVTFTIISPDNAFALSAAPWDSDIVDLIKTDGSSILLGASIGLDVQRFLVTSHAQITANILKIPGHLAENTLDPEFLSDVHPDVAIISAGTGGVGNKPSKKALSDFASSTTATILRTDQNGIIDIAEFQGKLTYHREK